MSTRTKKVDLSGLSYCHYSSDLQIEPQIPKVKHKDAFFELKTVKDEDVQVVNGEITVVTSEVTSLKAMHKPNESVYGADGIRAEVETIAALAKANKANLNGQVVLRDAEGNNLAYRILVTDNKVEVQEGKIAARWPDGTTSDLPGA